MLEKLCIALKKKNKGFTLIELIVVIAILGILAAVLIPTFSGFQDKAKGTQALVEAKQWATAADAYLVEKDVAAINAAAITAIDGTAGTPTGNVALASVSVSSGHVLFTYNADNGFTATRAADGKFTVAKTVVTP